MYRTLFGIALSLLLLCTVAAQPRYELVPYKQFDANGVLQDLSGDGDIWGAMPHQHAVFQVQAALLDGPAHQPNPGHISRRAGVEGIQIIVDTLPKALEIQPTSDLGTWTTDEYGVFELTVKVPESEDDYQIIFRTEDPNVTPLIMDMQVKSRNWALWLALGLFGGLAIFLHGMAMASAGLQDAAGSGLKSTLQRMTDKPSRGMVMGILATVMTQSSSATTVMLVGFVRAGLITLRQSFGPICGAAIGTTLTVQLLAFRIQEFALPMIALGGLLMVSNKTRPRTAATGKVIFGFGLIFFGMAVMSEVIEPLKNSASFSEIITRLTNRPLTCTLMATIFTALVQSSGATLGMAITLANSDLIDVHQALPIIFGANIGTCVTAILASMGGSADGKRVAFAHLIFKVGGVIIFLPWFMSDALAWMSIQTSTVMAGWVDDPGLLANTPARQLANAHTLFSVLTALVTILFLSRPLEALVCRIIPPEPERGEGRAKFLDNTLLDSPVMALGATRREISRMGRFVEEMVKKCRPLIEEKDPELIQWLNRRDDKVDRAFARINKYLTQLTGRNPSPEESERAIAMLYVINDLESLGDLVVKSFVPIVNKMIDYDLHLSGEGLEDILALHRQVVDSLAKTMVAFTDPQEAALLEEVIDRQEDLQVEGRRLHLRHLKRLQEGLRESIETSTIHLDIISCLLRMHHICHSISWTLSRGVSAHEELTG